MTVSSVWKLECYTVRREFERDVLLVLKGGISGEQEERVLLQWRKNVDLRFSIFRRAVVNESFCGESTLTGMTAISSFGSTSTRAVPSLERNLRICRISNCHSKVLPSLCLIVL